jgi:peptidoglycan hydrolase-like protein with peptidoglycan-binding domain
MQDQSDVRSARAVVFWLAALVALLALPSGASAQTTAAAPAATGLGPSLLAEASWHGRPIQRPWRVRRVAARADASAAPTLRAGTGFARAGGSDRVRALQRRLTRLGYRPGSIDGLFGPRTQAAVIAFQRKHDLPQTGIVGAITLRTVRSRAGGRTRGAPARSGPLAHPEPARADAQEPAAAQPSRADELSEPSPAAARPEPNSAGGDGGLDTTPLTLALAFTALLAVLVLAAMFGPRRRKRRVLAPAPAGARDNGRRDRVIGYAVGDALGFQRQADEIAAACERHHLELLQVLGDPPDTGIGARDRPGLRRVLRRVIDGEVSTVVVAALDQLGANDAEIRGVLRTVALGHASVIALGKDTRTSNAGGWSPRAHRPRRRTVVKTGRERVMVGIVEAAGRERDSTAEWREFVRRFAPYVHAVAVRAYRLPEAEAEQVFYDVFARTWVGLDELRDDHATRAWITGLTRDLAETAQERRGRDLQPPLRGLLNELEEALTAGEAVDARLERARRRLNREPREDPDGATPRTGTC